MKAATVAVAILALSVGSAFAQSDTCTNALTRIDAQLDALSVTEGGAPAEANAAQGQQAATPLPAGIKIADLQAKREDAQAALNGGDEAKCMTLAKEVETTLGTAVQQ